MFTLILKIYKDIKYNCRSLQRTRYNILYVLFVGWWNAVAVSLLASDSIDSLIQPTDEEEHRAAACDSQPRYLQGGQAYVECGQSRRCPAGTAKVPHVYLQPTTSYGTIMHCIS